ncbi:MAG: hypothetical protein WD077_01510 [Bacteroidia bacterium]
MDETIIAITVGGTPGDSSHSPEASESGERGTLDLQPLWRNHLERRK